MDRGAGTHRGIEAVIRRLRHQHPVADERDVLALLNTEPTFEHIGHHERPAPSVSAHGSAIVLTREPVEIFACDDDTWFLRDGHGGYTEEHEGGHQGTCSHRRPLHLWLSVPRPVRARLDTRDHPGNGLCAPPGV
jgi:hypothetical protein